jgi:hydrogenase maturation protein HypF
MKGMTIHMEGQVQGVGMRPYVYRLARRHRLKGWICSEPDGIRIQVEGDDNQMGEFVETLRAQLPPHARVSRWITRTVRPKGFAGFEIVGSRPEGSVTADITPDVPLCDDCRNEIRNPRNPRHNYPFTSCTHCGPRYSIQTQIPFDRVHTSMAIHAPCPRCAHEAQTQTSRRYFSQAHSCPDCAIPLTLLDGSGSVLATDWKLIRSLVINQLKQGLILAIKGTGGYELVADACNPTALQTLRLRKGRPSDPLAVMYPDMYTVKGDTEITPIESAELFGLRQPIVVVRKKNRPASKICSDLIAPHLDTLGVMLPYTALFELLLHAWGKPLVVTSANVSGAPVEYRDAEALVNLKGMADGFLTYQLNLVVPQDESVVRFAPESGQLIMLRRGRGQAPSIQVKSFSDQTVLAMGADTQGAFGLQTHGHIFVSQFLGNLQASRSRKVYRHTLHHLVGLTRSQPIQLLVDRYARHATRAGEAFADHGEIPVTHIPHGHAHAFSVMAENQL